LFDQPIMQVSSLPFPNIDPVAVQLGPLAIHWYGLAYVVGIMFAWWYSRRLIMTPQIWGPEGPQMTVKDIDDFVVWSALGIVLGGRIGYVLFYDLQRYLANPADIFAVWQGGMSFHGGFAGTTLAMILFARQRRIRIWSLFDVIAAVAPVGIGLVRLTNFINSELWGRASDMPWGVVFPNGGPLPRHPSQIYEALLEGLVLFVLLRLLTHRFRCLRAPGMVSGAFAAGYGTARIFVEFFREPDAQIGYLAGGWLTMGMVLSLPMVAFGVWAILRARAATA